MAPSSSDLDSPKYTKSSSSSSSSSSSEEENKSIRTVHPGSPSNAHQSSDESTSSDGVLVELPNNPDQDARGLPADADGGIFVNIDGSMQDGREDLFVDAPEELGSARGVGLDSSLAMIDYEEGSAESSASRSIPRSAEDELARMRDRPDDAQAQCRKYKEEREVFGREVTSLRHQILEMFDQLLLPVASNESIEYLRQMGRGGSEEEVFMSPTPLHSMVKGCSKMLSHLKIILDEQLNLEDNVKGLNAVLYAKEQEVEDLNLKLAESNVCQDVVISYLGSIRESWSKSLKESSDEVSSRLLASLETVIGQESSSSKDSAVDGILLVEKKTVSLIEKHSQLLLETQQLRQFLAETRPELLTSEENSFLYSVAREELLESKRKEASLLEKVSELVDENRRMAEEVNMMKESLEVAIADTNKTKMELEQAENKLAAAREKLSIAVSKGKSLVQHRDVLKQSLAEKTSELENCMLQLRQKCCALEASEASTQELKQLFAEKTNELENCLLELQQKSTALETTETSSLKLNQSLAEKTSELEKCVLELQQKSEALAKNEAIAQELKQSLAKKIGELDECSLELRQKSDALENTETNCEEQKQLVAEKNVELEKCLFDLQQKSSALEASELNAEELRQMLAQKTVELENCLQKLQQIRTSENTVEEPKMSLAEKVSELEKCQLELQEKYSALKASELSAEELRQMLAQKTVELENCLQKLQQMETSESTVEELKMSLTEKVSELEKCQLELQQKSNNLQTAIITTVELKDTQNLVSSLQDLLSEKNRILQEIEEIMQHTDSQEDLFAMEFVDRVKWCVDHKHKSDAVMTESNKIKDTLSSVDLPEAILSTALDSQIEWLVESFAQAKEDIVKLQEEISAARISVASHDSELSEAHKEIDRLAASLSEVKQEKDSVHHDLKCKCEKIAEKLSLISSENYGLMKERTVPSASTLDDQLSLDPELFIENCIATISEIMKTSFTEREKFEEIQTLLYIKYQEQMLCENILEEAIIIRSEINTLTNELGRASEEVITLRNEKEALHKELERVEERSSLIREKLSMAVKKGKGLVQEREGFKHSLDVKNSEIEKLKQELQHQESAIIEYKEQIKSLSSYPEHVQKLESDIVSLKDLREQTEKLLLESSKILQTLVESIENIALPADKTFEKPIEKLYWIAEHIRESEVAKARREQELEELKSEATLQVNRLADVLGTIDILKDKLSTAERHMHDIAEEKKDMQLGKLNIEQELERLEEVSSMKASKLEDAYETIRSLEDQLGKMNIEQELEEQKEEISMLSGKLEDAYATIKSLEDTLAHTSNSLSNFKAEKDEIEFKSKQQIDALNAQLADCMEELVVTRSSLENESGKLDNHLGDLKMLIKDERLFSLITEEFRKKIEALKHMGILIQDLHEQFSVKGLHIHTGFEVPDFANFSSLLKFEDFINDGMFNGKISTDDLDNSTTLSKIVEGLQYQTQLLGNWFQGLSRYMDDHVAVISQFLQSTRKEFIHMLEHCESLILAVNRLEGQNKTQEVKIISLEKEAATLLFACQDATQVLQIEFSDLLEFYPEHDIISGPGSIEAIGGRQDEGEGGEYAKAAESLLLATRKIGIQAQHLMSANRVLVTSVKDLKNKLKQAELTVETAIQDMQLSQERLLQSERDLEELQNLCSEMRVKIEDNQVKGDMLRDKEEELSSLQNALTAKTKEIGESLFSEGQVEAVIDKVNNMVIPFNESQIQEVHFSSTVEKLFYILDNFSELQHRVDSLTYEKEDMQLILESHVREIEYQKKAAETIGTNYQDLESKKLELIELTVGLEKIIQKFGANNLTEDQKPTPSKGFLPALERLMITSYNELEVSKSRMQELGAKLQAKEKVVDELLTKNKLLEDSIHARLEQPDIVKERAVFDASTAAMGSEISEIEDVGPLGKTSISSPPAAHVRTVRKMSTDHLALNIDSDSDPLISAHEADDKGHVFKSLNASGFIPKQGKMIADRVDSIWVSGGRFLMNRPGARLGLLAYWIFLHLWLLGTIL